MTHLIIISSIYAIAVISSLIHILKVTSPKFVKAKRSKGKTIRQLIK
jgi:hypothetical protein